MENPVAISRRLAGTDAQNRTMAEAPSDPRPVSVVAVDGAAVDNVRSSADQTQVPFRFSSRDVSHARPVE